MLSESSHAQIRWIVHYKIPERCLIYRKSFLIHGRNGNLVGNSRNLHPSLLYHDFYVLKFDLKKNTNHFIVSNPHSSSIFGRNRIRQVMHMANSIISVESLNWIRAKSSWFLLLAFTLKSSKKGSRNNVWMVLRSRSGSFFFTALSSKFRLAFMQYLGKYHFDDKIAGEDICSLLTLVQVGAKIKNKVQDTFINFEKTPIYVRWIVSSFKCFKVFECA